MVSLCFFRHVKLCVGVFESEVFLFFFVKKIFYEETIKTLECARKIANKLFSYSNKVKKFHNSLNFVLIMLI